MEGTLGLDDVGNWKRYDLVVWDDLQGICMGALDVILPWTA